MAANLGEREARLKWRDGLNWDEVAEKCGINRETARSRARRWKEEHPEDGPGDVPKEKNPLAEEVPPDFEGVKVEDQDFNNRFIYCQEPMIRTLEQLLKETETDLDTWYVYDHQLRAWPLHAKRERKKLEYEGGKIVKGFIDKGGMYQVQNVYIRAWLKRRNPEPIRPVLQPIEMPALQFRAPERPAGYSSIRQLTFADTQIGFRSDLQTAKLDPFHDREALDLVVQIAVAAGVDRIDIVGDFLDLTQATEKFLEEPEFKRTQQPALLEAHWWLHMLRELTGAHALLYEGNHCVRLQRMLMKKMPWVYGLHPADDVEWPILSVPRLLNLSGLGIEWVGDYPDGESWLGERICFKHGDTVRKGSGRTAAAVIDATSVTLVCGHVHREERATKTVWLRDGCYYVTVQVVPCTCRTDGTVPGSTRGENWQQGCLLIDYDLPRDKFTMQPILFEDGVAVWNGQVFEARDRTDELAGDLPGWNW